MKNEKMNSITKQFWGSKRCLTLCILLIVSILFAWSINGVLAKYVTSDEASNSANVAGVGVEILNLVQYGQAVAGLDYSKVVPGADIPGPHIQLKINSEVSYTLYVRITVQNLPSYTNDDGETVNTVYFDLTDDWTFVDSVDADNYTTSTYKYVVDTTNNVKNYVFNAGEEHEYIGDNEITILKNDLIYVSDRYSDRDGMPFSIKFEVYIRQVL